jgi:hypothetical protein
MNLYPLKYHRGNLVKGIFGEYREKYDKRLLFSDNSGLFPLFSRYFDLEEGGALLRVPETIP